MRRSTPPVLLAAILVGSCTTANTTLAYTRAGAIAAVEGNVRPGDSETKATARLKEFGFRCRPLGRNEYSSFDGALAKFVQCHTEADRTPEGYTLVYGSLSIDSEGRVIQVHAVWYPVVYRNLRRDASGRIIVVPEHP